MRVRGGVLAVGCSAAIAFAGCGGGGDGRGGGSAPGGDGGGDAPDARSLAAIGEIERSISGSLSRPDPFDGDAPVERYTVTCGRDVAIATGASLACDVATDRDGTGTITVTVASDDGADYSYRGEVRTDEGSQTLEGRTAGG